MNQQARQALDRANEVRIERSRIKREVFEGKRSVADLILDPPAELERMALFDLIRAQRRVGDLRARKVLHAHVIGEKRQIGQLTERQRQALAVQLGRSR